MAANIENFPESIGVRTLASNAGASGIPPLSRSVPTVPLGAAASGPIAPAPQPPAPITGAQLAATAAAMNSHPAGSGSRMPPPAGHDFLHEGPEEVGELPRDRRAGADAEAAPGAEGEPAAEEPAALEPGPLVAEDRAGRRR
jgi:hypothetical protein